MKKLETMLFLLILAFGSHTFAESAKNEIKNENLIAYLAIDNIDKEGVSLTLNDGSEWEITYFCAIWKLVGWGWTEQSNISHWTIEDSIEIYYPASGNFIDFVLVVYNISKNECVLARLKNPPSTDYSACLWIVDFDESTSRVTLSNGTTWFKTKTNMYGAFFEQKSSPEGNWQVGDAITLIRGEGWLCENEFFIWHHSSNELLLVNILI